MSTHKKEKGFYDLYAPLTIPASASPSSTCSSSDSNSHHQPQSKNNTQDVVVNNNDDDDEQVYLDALEHHQKPFLSINTSKKSLKHLKSPTNYAPSTPSSIASPSHPLLFSPQLSTPGPAAYKDAPETTPLDDNKDDDPEALLYAAADTTFYAKQLGLKKKRHANLSPLPIHYDYHDAKDGGAETSYFDSVYDGQERGLWRTVKGWYAPVYDYRTPGLSREERKKRVRYCGGKMSKWGFIWMHIGVIFLLSMIILGPIMYFVIIPLIIQNTLNATPLDSLSLSTMQIHTFSNTSISFYLKATLPPPTIFPIWAGVGDTTFRIHDPSENRLLEATIPGFDFKLNDPIQLNFNGTLSFQNSNLPALQTLVETFSVNNLNAQTFKARSDVQVKVLGMTIYSALPIYKDLDLPRVKNDLVSVFTVLPKFARVPSNQMNALIKSAYPPSSLLTILDPTLFPLIALKDLKLTPTDTGFSMTIETDVENPTFITLKNLGGLSFGIGLGETGRLGVGSLQGVQLSEGLQTMKLDVDFKVDTTNPETLLAELSKVVSGVLRSFNTATTTNPEEENFVSLIGPLDLQKTSSVAAFTGPLRLRLPVVSILKNLVPASALENLLTTQGLTSILSNTTLNFQTEAAQRLDVDVSLVLPRLFPLPPQIEFPYETSMEIHSPFGEGKLLEVRVGGVEVLTREERMEVKASVGVLGEEREEASVGLGKVVNPLVAVVPADSAVQIRRFGIYNPATSRSFAWLSALFPPTNSTANNSTTTPEPLGSFNGLNPTLNPTSGSLTLTLPFTLLPIDTLLDFLTARQTSLPFSISTATLHQRETQLNLRTHLALALPAGVPKLSASVGFFSLQFLIAQESLMNFQAPKGVKILNETLPEALEAVLDFEQPSTSLTEALQRFADSLLPALFSDLPASTNNNSSSSLSSVGLTGLTVGASESERISTFSKVEIHLPVSKLLPILQRTSQTIQSKLLTPRSIQVSTADLQVRSGTDVQVGAGVGFTQTLLEELNVRVGEVGVEVGLGGVDGVVGVRVPGGVQVESRAGEQASVGLNVGMVLSDGSNGADVQVARTVDAFLLGSELPVVQVYGISLGPLQTFRDLRITLPASLLTTLNPIDLSTGTLKPSSPLDLSPLLPSTDFLTQLNPRPANILLRTRMNAVLQTAGEVSYTNPLSLSGSIPFLSAAVGFPSANEAIRMNAQGLSIVRGEGKMSPQADLTFSQESSVADALAVFVEGVLETDRIRTPVVVSSVRFGSAAEDASNLFRLVRVDVSPFLKDLAVGETVKSVVNSVLPFPLPATPSQLFNYIQTSNVGGGVRVATRPQKRLDLGMGLQVNLPFSLDLDLGFLNLGLGLSNHPVGDIGLPRGLRVSSRGSNAQVDLQASMAFTDTPETQTAVSQLLQSFFAGSQLFGPSTVFQVSHIQLGSSNTDLITALSKILVSLPLDSLLKLEGPTDVTTLFATLQPNLRGAIGIQTLPNQRLGLNASLGVRVPLNVEADIGFLSADASLNTHPLGRVELENGLKVSGGPWIQVGVETAVQMLDNEQTQEVVGGVVQRLVDGQNLGVSVGVGRVQVGAAKGDVLSILDQCVFPLDLDRALRVVLMGNATTTPESVLDVQAVLKNLNPSVGPTDLVTRAGATLGVNTSVEFQLALPFQVSFKAGYFAAQAGLSGSPLAQFALGGLDLDGVSGNRSRVAVETDVKFVDDEGARRTLGEVVKRFLDGTKLEGTADIGKIEIGVSPTDTLTVLRKVNAGLNLDLIADSFLPRNGSFDLGAIAGKFISDALTPGASTVVLRKAGVTAKPGKQLDASLQAQLALPLPFPVTLNVGYLSIDSVNVDDVSLLSAAANGFVYDASNNTQVTATATIRDSASIQSKLAGVIQGYVSNGVFPSTAGVAGIRMGLSAQDTINAFSQVAVSLPINPVAQPIAKVAIETFQNILNGIPGGQLEGIVNGNSTGPITLQLGQNITVTLNKADIAFASGARVNAALEAGLHFPFAVDANVPFVAIQLGLDDVQALAAQVNGINIVGGGVSSLALTSGIQVQDSDPLADAVARMADAFFSNAPTIPGNLRLSGAQLGASSSDAITAFSGVAIPIPANMLLQPFLTGLNRTIDPVALLKRFGVTLKDIGASTAAGRSIDANVGVGFNDFFPFSIQLPYVSLAGGLDDVDILGVGVRDLQLQPGANDLRLNAAVNFPSSVTIQDKVAAFAAALSTGGFGNTVEDFSVSGITLGVSASDSIKALSKMRVKLPSKSLLTEANFNALLAVFGLTPGDLTLDELMKRLDVRKVNLDGSQAGKLRADAVVGLKGLKLNANIHLGYAGAAANLDGSSLLDAALPSGIVIKTENDEVVLNIGADVFLKDGEPLQNAISRLVDEFVSTGPFSGTAGASNLVFGASGSDFIDTLSKATVSLKMDPFLQPIRKFANDLIDGVLNGQSSYKLGLQSVVVDMESSTTLAVKGEAKIDGLPGDISVNIPYFSTAARFNGQDFIAAEVNGLKFTSGVVSAVARISFTDNEPVADELFGIVGNLAFHRPMRLQTTATATGITFGASSQDSFKLASKAAVTVGLQRFAQLGADYFEANRPLELHDIQAQVLGVGIQSHVVTRPLPASLPISANLGTVAAKVLWRMEGKKERQYTVVDAYFTNVKIAPNQPISFDLLLAPDMGERGVLTPLNEAIPYLVQFEDYAQHAWLGAVNLYKGEAGVGEPFSIFRNSMFRAPDLYLWQPITIKPVASNIFTREGLRFKLEFSFPNPGPLHLNVGSIVAGIKDRDDRTDIIRLSTPGPVVVQNVNEGANENGGRDAVLNNEFEIVIPWSDFNPFTFFGRLVDLIEPLKNYDIVIETIRPGEGPVSWVNKCLEQLPGNLVANLLPVVVALLSKVKIELFGFSLSASLIPGLSRFLDRARQKLDQFPVQHWDFLDNMK
ncbi:hypothetical protein HDV05_002643 [Chytridiales sp. JEL 0842]|nr:hypothetical protein HDV05_002643 [Chytridiales sp. JEL 0842]